MSGWAAAAGGIANLAGSAINAGANAQLSKRQRRYNDLLFDKEAENRLHMWNLQNEYNTPKAQMERFQEAGLNPNLIYGQGTPGNAQKVDTTTHKGYPTPEMNIQIPNIFKEIQEAKLRDTMIEGQTQKNIGLAHDNSYKVQTLQSRIDARINQNNLLLQRITNERMRKTIMDENLKLIKQKLEIARKENQARQYGFSYRGGLFDTIGRGLTITLPKAFQESAKAAKKAFLPAIMDYKSKN